MAILIEAKNLILRLWEEDVEAGKNEKGRYLVGIIPQAQ